MNPIRLLEFLPLLIALLLAAIQDWRSRRIANLVTIPLLLAGLARSFIGGIGIQSSLLGAAVGFGLTFVLFVMQAIRGGDVKLLTAIGAWLGPVPTLAVFATEAIVGMVIVLVQAIIQGRFTVLVRNSFMLTLALAQTNQAGIENIIEIGNSSKSVRRPLPYAVPVLIATLMVLVYLNC